MPGKPWGYEAFKRPQVSTRPSYDEAGNLLGRSFQLSPNLESGERGGILPPAHVVTWNNSGAVHLHQGRTASVDVLRTALLFVDKIDIPDNSNFSFGSTDLEKLAAPGVGSRSNVSFEGGVGPDVIFRYPWLCYEQLNNREPGMWSIWQQPDQQIVPDEYLSPDLGFQLSVNNALIIPHSEVPYEDVLVFKDRHKDELISLHHHIMKLAIKISKETDPRAITIEREAFDLSLTDYLRKARQSNLRRAVASLTVEMDWSAAIRSLLGAGGATLIAAANSFSLGAASVIIGGGALAGLSLKSSAGFKEAASEPFRYIARAEREFGA